MPPKVELHPYLTLQELKVRYRQATSISEARRWQLLHVVLDISQLFPPLSCCS
jgi:hypothetical protein